MKRYVKLPLFWKFTVVIAITVSIFGSINLYFLSHYVSDLFEKELSDNGLVMAKNIADRSIDPILYNDLATLNKLVTEVKLNDKNIAYTFILDAKNHVLAHTFNKAVPNELINLKNPSKIQTIKLEFQDSITTTIRDISVPILDGNLGTVRLGFYEENYLHTINVAKSFFLSLVVIFLIVGILGALLFSYIITKPINILNSTAKQLNLKDNNINDLNTNRSYLFLKLNHKLNIQDEIDDLFITFNNMVKRLQKTYSDLQSAQESLMQSEKIAAIGTLSAGIAHEINNPIAGIQNCLRRISEHPENMKQNTTYLELMSEAINKIKLVVGGLLNFSRKHELAFKIIDLKIVIEDVLLLIAFQLEKSQIGFTKYYQSNLPLVKGSKNHLEQVVLNLLINAIDAINERLLNNNDDKGEILINLHQDSGYVKLEIKDNGIGIPDEKINNIFDPFFTMKKIKQGTGLGLSVSYNIIAQHKGAIKVKKNSNFGMCFTISLPIEKS